MSDSGPTVKEMLEGAETEVKVKRGKTRAVKVAKSFNLFLDEKHMAALERMAKEKCLTKSQLMRQALRLYQIIDDRLKSGEKIYCENDKKLRSEIVLT